MARGVMPAVEHIEAIKRLSPKTLIDVGANKGQFSLIARYLFPDIEIYAFEPFSFEAEIFRSVVRGPVRLYDLAIGQALNSETFYVMSRRDSSSLLKPTPNQRLAYDVSPVSSITVQVARLCDFLELDSLARPILLKIDVQGGELDVLKSAGEAIRFIDFVYCEISYISLYEKQCTVDEIVRYTADHGLRIQGVFNQSVTSAFGPTQADMLFANLSR